MSLKEENKKEYKEYESSLENTKEIGAVVEIFPPIAHVEGLPNACINEIIYSESGGMGFVMALDKDSVEILMLTKKSPKVGEKITRSGNFLSVPVGKNLLGEVIDSLGSPIYDGVIISGLSEVRLVDTQPLGISSRERITDFLETGVSIVDLMIPLGKGQRELVIGDGRVGKTEFLLRTALSQAQSNTIVIYACIGNERVEIRKKEEFAKRLGIKEKMIIIASSASDPLGMIYLTPYTAMTMAEYFRDLGMDTFVVLDDLTAHAKYYREISLIARKFPGREAYPGDIFHVHARILERAGRFKVGNKFTTITCFPVANTVEGDISGYIQTNLMSMTDGHILFDNEYFKEGRFPAIHPFLSVTRVGRQTQSKLRWGINRELASFMSLYEKTRNVVHFGTELNEGIKATLSMGDKMKSFFNQPLKETIPLNVQIVVFCLIWSGVAGSEDAVSIQGLLARVTKDYKENDAFRKKVDVLINETEEFNELLGKISSQYKEVFSFLNTNEEKQSTDRKN